MGWRLGAQERDQYTVQLPVGYQCEQDNGGITSGGVLECGNSKVGEHLKIERLCVRSSEEFCPFALYVDRAVLRQQLRLHDGV